MKLIKSRVEKFRNYVDSEEVKIEDSITSLIGKNESGKTAFLKALYSIKPDNTKEAEINIDIDYPRWFKVRDARQMDINEISLIKTCFSLDQNNIDYISKVVGVPLLENTKLSIERTYSGNLKMGLWVDEEEWVKFVLKSDMIKEELKPLISDSVKSEDVIRKIKALKDEKNGKIENLKTETDEISNDNEVNEESLEESSGDAEVIENEEITKIKGELIELDNLIGSFEKIQNIIKKYLTKEEVSAIYKIVPTFFYFGAYNTLKGRIDLNELISKNESELDKEDQTALALLKLVGVSGQELMDDNYEIRKAELESAASEVTRQVLDYWTQNDDIDVDLDNDAGTVQTPTGQNVVHRFLEVRLRDQRHSMTTNFSTRSSGFQWFFSFIVAFSDFNDRDDVIILLDEPGLGLHGKAQEDLLNFIEKELGNGRQVIYTNHSPFMVNPKKLERVRLVEDNTSREDCDLGSKISEEVLYVKRPETLFPLQAALGYDIAQNLFIGQYNLIVEGPSDYLYLDLLSEYLNEKGMCYLDNRIIIVPVGGADKIPTFVALLGNHLNVSVLVDSDMRNNQKIQDMIKARLLEKQRFVTVGQITKNNQSNIEDLFSEKEYLELYNEAFTTTVNPTDLQGNDSIVDRLERYNGGRFNHYKPLQVLQKNPDKLKTLSEDTLKRFELLFEKLNKTFNFN